MTTVRGRALRRHGPATSDARAPHRPFTAIRLVDGNILIGSALGYLAIEADPTGTEVWRVTNDDPPGKHVSDACGVRSLSYNHTAITSHHAAPKGVKLTEIIRDKKII